MCFERSVKYSAGPHFTTPSDSIKYGAGSYFTPTTFLQCDSCLYLWYCASLDLQLNYRMNHKYRYTFNCDECGGSSAIIDFRLRLYIF